MKITYTTIVYIKLTLKAIYYLYGYYELENVDLYNTAIDYYEKNIYGTAMEFYHNNTFYERAFEYYEKVTNNLLQ